MQNKKLPTHFLKRVQRHVKEHHKLAHEVNKHIEQMPSHPIDMPQTIHSVPGDQSMNEFKKGGYISGQELDLSEEEIQNLIQQGYKIERL